MILPGGPSDEYEDPDAYTPPPPRLTPRRMLAVIAFYTFVGPFVPGVVLGSQSPGSFESSAWWFFGNGGWLPALATGIVAALGSRRPPPISYGWVALAGTVFSAVWWVGLSYLTGRRAGTIHVDVGVLGAPLFGAPTALFCRYFGRALHSPPGASP